MSADAIIAFGVGDGFNLENTFNNLPYYFAMYDITEEDKRSGYAPPNTNYYVHTGLHYFDKGGGVYREAFKEVIATLLNLLDDVNVGCVYYGYDCLDQTKLFTMQDWHDIVEAYETASRKEYNQ